MEEYNPPFEPFVARLRAVVVSGREAILPYAPVLEQLAEQFGQHGAMNWLQYFLSGESARFKFPRLVLLLKPGETSGLQAADTIVGCALFAEYAFWGVKTGAIATEDASGFRTVLAPVGQRAEVAARCAAELLDRGAHVALVTYMGDASCVAAPVTKVHAAWACRTRTLGTHLDLEPDYSATLAHFNRTVRFRLGYFRRRLVSTTPCTYLPDAASTMTESEFLALNRGCLNPVSDSEAEQRWRACRLPGGYAVGLRTDAGEWLAIIGGWRQGATTVLHWQLNRAGWEKHSLTTVMRSYYLEHETKLGTKRVVFFGGTPHSIRHYFPQGDTADLMLRRSTLRAGLLMFLARQFATRGRAVRRPNFLADTLSLTDLKWSGTATASDGKRRSMAQGRRYETA